MLVCPSSSVPLIYHWIVCPDGNVFAFAVTLVADPEIGKDCQVLAEPNLQRIKSLCPQAETRLLPGLNHLFQHCTTGLPEEYFEIEETIAPETLEIMTKFIKNHK